MTDRGHHHYFGFLIGVLIVLGHFIALWLFAAPDNTNAQIAPFQAHPENSTPALFNTPDGRNLLGFEQDRIATLPELPPKKPKPKIIALTFDDGPHSRHTPAILDVLQKHQVPATFFVLGARAQAQPELLRRMNREGHQIGNHTWNHRFTKHTPLSEIQEQFQRTSETLYRITGVEPTVLRTPGGLVTNDLLQTSLRPIVLWSVDTRDWSNRTPLIIRNRATRQIHPGAVVLMHDIYYATVLALDPMISDLKRQGYRFVTVDELFGFSGEFQRGVHYMSELEHFIE